MARREGRVVAVCAAACLLASTCTGSKPEPEPTLQQPRKGGEIIVGAQSWLGCINPITGCGSAPTNQTMLRLILPRAMELDPRGSLRASALLSGAPSLETGSITQNPFTIAFHISRRATWDDGSPITSRDFEFTWRAILNTPGAYSTEGYDRISSIDTSDPRVALVGFSDVVVDWADLFGGLEGYVLKRSAFPDADPQRPDLSKEMFASVPFSGGPFKLYSWGIERAVFVRNPRSFYRPANLDRVTFVRFENPADGMALMGVGKADAVSAGMYGWLDPTTLPTFGPLTHVVGADGPLVEAIWINHGTPPLDNLLVRQALMLAIDRQGVVDQIVKPVDPSAKVSNCGLTAAPNLGPWCHVRPFERYEYDPARARSLLAQAGYDCSSTPCRKDGKPLTLTFAVHSQNERRRATFDLLAANAREAGFDLRIGFFESSPGIDFSAARLWALVNRSVGEELDPSVTDQFACDEIPSEGGDGDNISRWCNEEAAALMRESDRELDPSRRLALFDRIYELEADDAVALPLHAVPVVSAWRIDKVAGPIAAYISSPYGMFFNLAEWFVPAGPQT